MQGYSKFVFYANRYKIGGGGKSRNNSRRVGVKNILCSYNLFQDLSPQKPNTIYIYIQGMVDGSASKPALRQDTGYMVEKTYYDIAHYLGAFGAYLMPQ